MAAVYGTIELGGTKTRCAVGDGGPDIIDELTIPTTEPRATMGQVIDHLSDRSLAAVGIVSFGPLEIRPDHPKFGWITTTPKPGWSDFDVLGTVAAGLGIPVAIDTDVNGAALGEAKWGAGAGSDPLVYITVGTGIGGGVLIGGRPLHGLIHPEMGHLALARHPDDDFVGSCPFHRDCAEGLASGPALQARFGRPAYDLEPTMEAGALELETFYLSQLLRAVVYTLAPQKVILGGGVMGLPGLFDSMQAALISELSGYPGLEEHRQGILSRPGLHGLCGLHGGIKLASDL